MDPIFKRNEGTGPLKSGGETDAGLIYQFASRSLSSFVNASSTVKQSVRKHQVVLVLMPPDTQKVSPKYLWLYSRSLSELMSNTRCMMRLAYSRPLPQYTCEFITAYK